MSDYVNALKISRKFTHNFFLQINFQIKPKLNFTENLNYLNCLLCFYSVMVPYICRCS